LLSHLEITRTLRIPASHPKQSLGENLSTGRCGATNIGRHFFCHGDLIFRNDFLLIGEDRRPHRVEFLDVPATGQPVKVWGIIDGVQDGKIKDTRLIMDSLGLMMQLGVFPSAKA
jgi:hypothetical protein